MATVTRIKTTGNLPAAIAATAIYHADKAEFHKSLPESGRLGENLRAVWIGYKVPKTPKEDVSIPESFSVVVPQMDWTNFHSHAKLAEFVTNLCNDYQDSVLHSVADKDSIVDATNLEALIADYFDTSRSKDGVTQKSILAWYDETFVPAFVKRKMELNATPGIAQMDDKTIEALCKAYFGHCKAITGRDTGKLLAKNIVKGLLQTVQRLAEMNYFDAEEENCKALVSKCEALLLIEAEVMEMAI